MRKKLMLTGMLAVPFLACLRLSSCEHAPLPQPSRTLNPERRNTDIRFDIDGRSIRGREAALLMRSEEGRSLLSRKNGAIVVTPKLIEQGRELFFRETFGNVLQASFTPLALLLATLELRGRGTNNLRVSLRDGSKADTGLSVLPRTVSVVGVKYFYRKGHLAMGVTCAACHTSLDERSGKLVEGAPNTRLNFGPVTQLLQIPDTFTWKAYPYGWKGSTTDAPFAGLSDAISRLHRTLYPKLNDGQTHALAAYTNTLLPPRLPVRGNPERIEVARQIFASRCYSCHSDSAYTNHEVQNGYKVKSLLGLFWSAPYLHDGSAGGGSELRNQKPNDPFYGLRALLDRDLRKSSTHAYWVDRKGGYSPSQQRALIEYLLLLDPNNEPTFLEQLSRYAR